MTTHGIVTEDVRETFSGRVPDSDLDLGWALVRITSAATHYTKVRIIKAQKRFTEVRSALGIEWREITRGLWTFPTEEEADAELKALDEIWRNHRPSFAAGGAA